MSGELAFDAYDRLVGRTSMVGSPITLVVRNPRHERIAVTLDRCLDLLGGRKMPDEILFATPVEPATRPPSQIGAVTIRTVAHSHSSRAAGLEWLLANSRWPVAVFAGSDAELSVDAFRRMLEALEHADVVVGRRRNLRGTRNPLSWWVRRLFAVGITDPLSPFVALRRESAANVPLHLDEPLTLFELYAKLTYAFAMYDEVEVAVDSTDVPLHRALLQNRSALAQLFRNPQFWRYSRELNQIRTPPQETRPPSLLAQASFAVMRTAMPHPLKAKTSHGFAAERSPELRLARR